MPLCILLITLYYTLYPTYVVYYFTENFNIYYFYLFLSYITKNESFYQNFWKARAHDSTNNCRSYFTSLVGSNCASMFMNIIRFILHVFWNAIRVPHFCFVRITMSLLLLYAFFTKSFPRICIKKRNATKELLLSSDSSILTTSIQMYFLNKKQIYKMVIQEQKKKKLQWVKFARK